MLDSAIDEVVPDLIRKDGGEARRARCRLTLDDMPAVPLSLPGDSASAAAGCAAGAGLSCASRAATVAVVTTTATAASTRPPPGARSDRTRFRVNMVPFPD